VSARDRLDAIAARLEAATKGPWEAVVDFGHGQTREHSVWAGDTSGAYVAEWIATGSDANLLANAPTDIAAMHAALTAVEEATDPRTLTHTLMRHWGYDDEDIAKAEADAEAYDDATRADPYGQHERSSAVIHLHDAVGAAVVFEEYIRRAVEAALQSKGEGS
jgi:hypothetical protein